MADEMGLGTTSFAINILFIGKTVQSVSFLYMLYKIYNVRGPFLIVAPLSTIPHWEREFRAWTDFNVIVYHGSAKSRNLIIETEYYYRDFDGSRLSDLHKFQVLITTYEMIRVGVDHLRPLLWTVGVFDEAHKLKNKNSKALETLRGFGIEHKILLTGTPLQNSVSELFSLLNFLHPLRFANEQLFLHDFGDLRTSDKVQQLQALLKPLMLRRFKEDVEKSIPVKEETVIEVELTKVQKGWYRAILERNFAWIQTGNKGGKGPSLLNIMMELRKCCNHPFLITGVEDRIFCDKFLELYPDKRGLVKEADMTLPEETKIQTLVESSGKMVLINKLLQKLKQGGHKVLIFSQMTKLLDLITEILVFRNYAYERIDGTITGEDRQAAIDRFCTSETSFVFLLSTKSGGVGINLTAADTVIIYDSDWNPQNDLQAQARVHRIGQKKPVKIYRILTRNTYERQMFEKANRKLGLDKAVLQKMDASFMKNNQPNTPGSSSGSGGNNLSKKEVEELLRTGAYGALLDDEEASAKFCEEDIDSILDRRTTVIKHNDGDKANSVFSKASFTQGADDDVDINDPHFWEKWADKADLNTNLRKPKNPLIIDEPRKRTTRTRYGAKENGGQDDLPLPNEDPDPFYEDEVADDLDFGSNSGGSKAWKPAERLKLTKNLMLYGYGDWKRLKKMFKKRDIGELRACSRVLVKVYMQNILDEKDGDLKGLSRVLKKLFSDIDLMLELDDRYFDRFYNNKATESDDEDVPTINWDKIHLETRKPHPDATRLEVAQFRSFYHDIQNESLEDKTSPADLVFTKGRNLLMRLQQVYIIKNNILPVNLDDAIKMEITDIKTCRPKNWWDWKCDLNLMVGMMKYGMHKYMPILKDDTLCFATMNITMIQPDKDQENNSPSHDDKVDNKDGNNSDEDHNDDAMSQDEDESFEDDKQTIDDNQDSIDQGPRVWPARAEIALRLKKVVNALERQNPKSNKVTPRKSKGRPRLPKNDKADDWVPSFDIPSNLNLEDLSVFPARITQLENAERIIYIIKNPEEGKGVKLVDDHNISSEAAKRINNGESLASDKDGFKWSKIQRLDFYRTLSSFGLETHDGDLNDRTWYRFRCLSNLNSSYLDQDGKRKFYKADSDLDHYATLLLSKAIQFFEDLSEDSKTEIEAKFPNMLYFASKLKEAFPVNEYVLHFAESNKLDFNALNFERAKRLLRRLFLLFLNRHLIFEHPNLTKIVGKFKLVVGLPSWWTLDLDYYFVQAVKLYGFNRVELILSDKELPFYQYVKLIYGYPKLDDQNKDSSIKTEQIQDLGIKTEETQFKELAIKSEELQPLNQDLIEIKEDLMDIDMPRKKSDSDGASIKGCPDEDDKEDDLEESKSSSALNKDGWPRELILLKRLDHYIMTAKRFIKNEVKDSTSLEGLPVSVINAFNLLTQAFDPINELRPRENSLGRTFHQSRSSNNGVASGDQESLFWSYDKDLDKQYSINDADMERPWSGQEIENQYSSMPDQGMDLLNLSRQGSGSLKIQDIICHDGASSSNQQQNNCLN